MTFTQNTTIVGAEGPNNVRIWANDSADNWGTSIVYFTVDTTPPTLTIASPENRTYATATVDLNVSADEAIDIWWYNVDGGANVTFTPNITLSGLSEGQHNITVYANDTAGNMNSTWVVYSLAGYKVHNLNTGMNYATIQAAVDAASPGDTISVEAGTYNENVDVTKSVNLVGAGAEVTIVNASDPNDHVFNVSGVNSVNISGFTVTGATTKSGVYLYNSNYSKVENANASNNEVGIYLEDSSDNTLIDNTASNNEVGIFLYSSSNNTIANKNASNNDYGIYLWDSRNNTIANNTASNNREEGIYLESSSNNTIVGNDVDSNNEVGIYIDYSRNNTLTDNNVSNNNIGIYIDASSNNTLTDNTASNNEVGIYLEDSSGNTLTNNTANSNGDTGIYVRHSSNYNLIANNNASNNYYGIRLYYSSNNTLTNNNASYNGLLAGAIRVDTGIYKVVYFSFGFEAINNSAMRDTVMNRTINWLYPSLSDNILLVDDDMGESDYETYYNDSLTNNSIGYDYWNVYTIGSPVYADLSSYPVVIWFTGDDYDYTLETNEQSALEQYLDNGGRLFLTGQDIGYYLIEEENDDGVFYSDYLHAFYAMDSTDTYGLSGVSGDPISDGLVIGIAGGDGANNQGDPSGIKPRESATIVFYYELFGGGIYLSSSSNNLIYNNYFNNTNNAYDDGNNIWNTTKTEGTNIIGGPYLGGNYWSDYEGEDTDGDGLGDTLLPYNSSGDIQTGGDWLPLVSVGVSECYIATATYGTPLDENINVLRDFRDAVLMTNPIGEAFVSTYYVTSPPIADALRENEGLRTVTRLTLITPLVYLSKFALSGIWLVFILGLAAVLLLRRDRMKILKSLLVGMGAILVFIAAIFSLGFVGYTIPFCAAVGAYMLPFVIPLSVVLTLETLLKMYINVSDNIKPHARDSKM